MSSSNVVILISPSRASSTSLRVTLDGNSEIAMHGELLASQGVLGISNKLKIKNKPGTYYRNHYPEKFLNKFFPDDQYIYGCNILLKHWFEPNNFILIDNILAKNVKVIILWRKNLLLRIKSQLLFKLDVGAISAAKLMKTSHAEIDIDCRKNIAMVKKVFRQLREIYHIEPKIIYFESLVSELSPIILNNLEEYLGVSKNNLKLSNDISRTKNPEREKVSSYLDQLLSKENLKKYSDVSFPDITSQNDKNII